MLVLAAAAAARSQADAIDFGIGPVGGYLKSKGADQGTWTAGLAARLRIIEYVGAEASVTFHENDHLDGNAIVSQIPVQLTAMAYPFPDWTVQPYALLGVGWYFTRIDYVDALSGLDSETDSLFGVHVGAGANIDLGLVNLFADIRYIFLDEAGIDNSDLQDEEYDSWQVTFGVMFGF
jgi:opacity protein-like surface antigen